MEVAFFWILLLGALLLLLNGHRRSRPAGWWLAGGTLFASLLGLRFWTPSVDPTAGILPPRPAGTPFETSSACRKCHPSQYSSWHDSFHRTMTQAVHPQAVAGDFDDVTLQMRGRTYHLQREGDHFWVEMNDPAWEMRFEGGPLPAGIPRVRERVVLTTGSHHLQVYWTLRPESNGMLFQFPFVYSIDQQRWIPAEDSFLRPPSSGPIEIDVWNSSCIACHAVGGEPFNDAENHTMYSRVAEYGIACEACHGPGHEHIRRQTQPWRRYALHLTNGAEAAIVNPERLSHQRSSEVCGSCHSASSELDERVWAGTGRRYRPGEDLERTRYVLRYAENPTDPKMVAWLSQDPNGLRDRFWPDGTMRVTGREFNAMIESACYQQGEISCLSCHSMHEGEPNDQLDPEHPGDRACLNCHDRLQGAALTEHTHHPAESSGSSCLNCHMPHTTYGLFNAMHSHRIDNPSVDQTLLYRRPNACNLCHFDRTLEWTGDFLNRWYGQPLPDLNREHRETSAALLWLLKGDAIERALTAWHLGWEPARQASGSHWQAPFLAQLLDDPYSVVRFLGGQALTRLPGFETFTFDFLAPAASRQAKLREALERWQSTPWPDSPPSGILLLSGPRQLNQERIQELIGQRDRRPVRIVE